MPSRNGLRTNVHGRWGGLRTPRPRGCGSRSALDSVEHLLEREPPKEEPPAVKGYGKYCIRAAVEMKTESGETVANIVGHHTSPEIIQHTELVCEARKDVRKGEVCTESVVTFTKYTPQCEEPRVEIKRWPPKNA